jgi:ribonuclease BN (tRNA processing enzyme)
VRLTVLGSGAACPPGGQNSSGYLVETGRDGAGGRRLLLDCGHGIASALLAARPEADIDDIWITHMHADHFIDVLALRFRVSRLLTGVPEAERRITLHLPPGGRARVAPILSAVSFPPDFLEGAFRVREYAVGDVYEAGGVQVRVAPGAHYIPSYAIRVEADGAALCYSGDTAPCPDVPALACAADLFICEAALDAPEDGDVRGHCTPEEAARMATQAGARRLLLSHFWYGADTEAFGRRARAATAVPVDVARDGYQRAL